MKLNRPQSGFPTIKALLLVTLIALVGYLGYMTYSSYKATTQEAISTKAENVQPAPAITETNDLDAAATTIDETQVEDTSMDDMNAIDDELSAF